MIDFSSLRGEMLPWYYKNAKLHNNELVAEAIGQESAKAAEQGQPFSFAAEYKKVAQRLGLYEPTGNIHLVADIELSNHDRTIFEKMDKDAETHSFKPMAVADIAFNYHLDGLLAGQDGAGITLGKTYFQRLLDDFTRANSPMLQSGIKPSTIQHFMDNFSSYEAGQPAAAPGVPLTSQTKHDYRTVIDKNAQKYDVRNMGALAMRGMSQGLYDNGVIDLSELGILTMVPIEAVDTVNGIEYRPFQTNEQKFNYLTNVKDALDFVKSHGKEDRPLEKVFAVLEDIDTAGVNEDNKAIPSESADALRIFPPPNAPEPVQRAYTAATAGMSSKAKTLAGLPFRALETSSNIKYDPQGNPAGIYYPGEHGYRHIYDEPGFSYQSFIDDALELIEQNKNEFPEVYQFQRNFLETFKEKLVG